MQGKSYINISELALLTNKIENYVRRDVKKMLQLGIFPEGHLDTQEACLIRGDVAYREYIRMEKSRKAIQAEVEKQKRIEARKTAKESERGIVDIETLKATNQTLISTLDEVMRVQTEGRAKRRAAEIELQKIENDMREKLLEMSR